MKGSIGYLLLLTVAVTTVRGQPWAPDLNDPAQWRPMPDWLANPSDRIAVVRTAEGLRFRVEEAGKGMKWLTAARWIATHRYRYFVVRYRCENVNAKSTDYFIWVNDSSRRSQEAQTLIRLSDLISDGRWHEVVADLRRSEIQPYLSHLALQVQSSDGPAEITIKEMSFRDQLPHGLSPPSEPRLPYKEILFDLSQMARVEMQPSWLINPAESASVALTRDGVVFRVKGSGRGMKWSVRIQPPLSLVNTPYLILDYRAVGLSPVPDYAIYAAPSRPVLPQSHYHCVWLDQLTADGKWRQTVVRVPEVVQHQLATIAIQVQSEQKEAELTIRNLRFASRSPDPQKNLEDFLPEGEIRKGRFICVDVAPLCNLPLSQIGMDLPVKEWKFRSPSLTAWGIPFRVATSERNVVSAEPVGDIVVELPGGLKSPYPTELYLLLAAGFPEFEEPSYGGGRMHRIRHPHRFAVSVRYADGRRESFFPLRCLSGKPEVVSGLDVYAVPLQSGARTVCLNDRMLLGEFGLCGLTVNVGEPLWDRNRWTAPSLPLTVLGKLRPASSFSVKSQKDAVLIENNNLRMRIQTNPPMLSELTVPSIGRNLLTRPAPLFRVASFNTSEWTDSRFYRLSSSSLATDSVVLEWTPQTTDEPYVTVTVQGDRRDTVTLQMTLKNGSSGPKRWSLSFPAEWCLKIGARDYYTYPFRTVVISDREEDYRYRYGGSLPLSFMDLTDPSTGIGLGIVVEDTEGWDRNFFVKRDGTETRWGVIWRCDPVARGRALHLPLIKMFVHTGGFKETFRRYRQWVRTWYHPLVKRKDWFRKVFAFRQDYLSTGLFDVSEKRYRFGDRVAFAKESFGFCDFLHIFDWGVTRERGRTGDYDPWNDRLTSSDEFLTAVAQLQRDGIPVGLYVEGYLVDERSRIGRAHREDWGLRMRDGNVEPWMPGSSEFVMCPGTAGWRQYLKGVYQRVQKETGALGFYIDEFGFCNRDCFATDHGHPSDWNVLRGEGLLLRSVRKALPDESVVYTENFPPDIHTPLQDGSFDYAISEYQRLAHRWMPVPVRLARFAFPDFKVFQIIVCDLPLGTNEEAVQQVFFNGDGYWIQGEPDSWWHEGALKALRKCLAILKKHSEAFVSDDCEPLVPTLIPGVFANRFSRARKTVWTLYNANWRSVSGEVLRIPHRFGATYYDEWNERPIAPRREGDVVYLCTQLGPHSVGCLVEAEVNGRDGTKAKNHRGCHKWVADRRHGRQDPRRPVY